jgi:hypothetical protein
MNSKIHGAYKISHVACPEKVSGQIPIRLLHNELDFNPYDSFSFEHESIIMTNPSG